MYQDLKKGDFVVLKSITGEAFWDMLEQENPENYDISQAIQSEHETTAPILDTASYEGCLCIVESVEMDPSTGDATAEQLVKFVVKHPEFGEINLLCINLHEDTDCESTAILEKINLPIIVYETSKIREFNDEDWTGRCEYIKFTEAKGVLKEPLIYGGKLEGKDFLFITDATKSLIRISIGEYERCFEYTLGSYFYSQAVALIFMTGCLMTLKTVEDYKRIGFN